MIQLRPYQEAGVNDIRASYRDGARAVLFSLPTGGGKTFAFSYIAQSAAARGNSVLIVVHRKELLRQASCSLAALGVRHGLIAPAEKIGGVISAHLERVGQSFIDAAATVHVASVQTLVKRLDQWRDRFALVILDEAHHAVSGSFQAVVDAMPSAKILGVTATPCRLDGKGLGDVFDVLVEGPTIRDLIDQGNLVQPKVYAPPTSIDLSNVHRRGGDFVASELAEAMDKPVITGDAVAHYRRLCAGMPGIAFCASVAHAEHVAAEFRRSGISAACVHGGMDDGERDRLILGHGRTVQVLTSCDLISEGTDTVAAQAALLLRPTESESMYLQQCLDEKTEILTARGWLSHEKISETDTVAAFDMETGRPAWMNINRIVMRELADGELMYGIQSPHLDIRVTGGHDMIVRAHMRTAGWKKETAEQMAKRRALMRIPVSARASDEMAAPLTDDEIRFIGWFLTDGTRNKRNNVISIAQSAGKPFHCDHIRKVINGCGFKYGEYRIKRKGEFAYCDDLIQFYVSKGKPRAKDKHLRGWENLEPWIDKSIGHAFEMLSPSQFEVLIEAMNLGDGANSRKTITWNQKTMTITTGDNKVMADRLQALCVLNGFRCNQSIYYTEGKNAWYYLHIRKSSVSTIAGANIKDGDVLGREYKRSRFGIVASTPMETVWCVENDLGTLITRRNGKVAILGNCGRILRPMEGKTHAVVLDHVGNTLRHGLPDADREWTLEGRKKRGKGGANDNDPALSVRQCEAPCFAAYAATLRACPVCGRVPPVKARELDQVDGELVEITAAKAAAEKARLERRREIGRRVSECTTLDELQALAGELGYASGWAWHRWNILKQRRGHAA